MLCKKFEQGHLNFFFSSCQEIVFKKLISLRIVQFCSCSSDLDRIFYGQDEFLSEGTVFSVFFWFFLQKKGFSKDFFSRIVKTVLYVSKRKFWQTADFLQKTIFCSMICWPWVTVFWTLAEEFQQCCQKFISSIHINTLRKTRFFEKQKSFSACLGHWGKKIKP